MKLENSSLIFDDSDITKREFQKIFGCSSEIASKISPRGPRNIPVKKLPYPTSPEQELELEEQVKQVPGGYKVYFSTYWDSDYGYYICVKESDEDWRIRIKKEFDKLGVLCFNREQIFDSNQTYNIFARME